MKNILRKGLAGCFLLFPLLASATEKSEAMGVKDPYGITLTVTSVMVVFVALLVLSIVYFYVGKIFTKGQKTSKQQKVSQKPAAAQGKPDEETALAIALALRGEMSQEAEVAVAMALHRYLSETAHDDESYVLTIRPTFGPYASRQFTLRQLPQRK